MKEFGECNGMQYLTTDDAVFSGGVRNNFLVSAKRAVCHYNSEWQVSHSSIEQPSDSFPSYEEAAAWVKAGDVQPTWEKVMDRVMQQTETSEVRAFLVKLQTDFGPTIKASDKDLYIQLLELIAAGDL